MARKSFTDKERLEIIKVTAKHMESGMLQIDCAALAGISEASLVKWCHASKERGDSPHYREILNKGRLVFKKSQISNVTKAGARDWKASAWYLKSRYPDEFSDKDKHNNNNQTIIIPRPKKG